MTVSLSSLTLSYSANRSSKSCPTLIMILPVSFPITWAALAVMLLGLVQWMWLGSVPSAFTEIPQLFKDLVTTSGVTAAQSFFTHSTHKSYLVPEHCLLECENSHQWLPTFYILESGMHVIWLALQYGP